MSDVFRSDVGMTSERRLRLPPGPGCFPVITGCCFHIAGENIRQGIPTWYLTFNLFCNVPFPTIQSLLARRQSGRKVDQTLGELFVQPRNALFLRSGRVLKLPLHNLGKGPTSPRPGLLWSRGHRHKVLPLSGSLVLHFICPKCPYRKG